MSIKKILTTNSENRIIESSEKISSTLIDIKEGSLIVATEEGLDIDLKDLALKSDTDQEFLELGSRLDLKVDKEEGKGLSDENFTSDLKEKLEALESSKYKGLFSSEQQLIESVTNPLAGDYADVDFGENFDVSRFIWDSSDSKWVLQAGESAPVTSSQIRELYESNPDTNRFTDAMKAEVETVKQKADKTELEEYLKIPEETSATEFETELEESLPLKTLGKRSNYLLSDPTSWIKIGEVYIPAYSKEDIDKIVSG